MIEGIDFSNWTDDQLGQTWANKIAWYLMEAKAGQRMLDNETHERLGRELQEIDAELRRRGLDAPPQYTQAFCDRRCLPKADMDHLLMLVYGRIVGIMFEEGQRW